MDKESVLAERNRLYSLFTAYDFRDKGRAFMHYCVQMLNRTQRMFTYTGLPDSIPQTYLERYLQCSGYACIAKVDGELYAFIGGLGGQAESPYYEPTWITVNNPALRFYETLEIDKDCAIIKNDIAYAGIRPIIARYATAMVENDISMNMVSKNMRASILINAPTDDMAEAANQFIEDLDNGKQTAVGGKNFIGGIDVFPMSGSGANSIVDLIEYHQYLRAGLYNELGLQSNFNMKREAINESESGMNDDILIPLIDEMLYERQEGVKRVNELFGTNITVDLASIWKVTSEEQLHPEEEEEEAEPEQDAKEGDVDAESKSE